ncbi:MAG: crossover junction endodeoxyribonuclease RuvC [Synergistetes bacterium]|nr:crossover junction endodeoxyribonuclease RuvC [Synergistota bacterium]MCX8127202.1 crossover junction endodeoxyribonuclease RuvC [Synergistota bacterium]MDW8191912.1 crossover junction endodeoxyribonuclease RuvC [Synergistota bacterium]
MGIDPGLRELGYVILEEGFKLLKSDTLYTYPDLEKAERLKIIYERLEEEVRIYSPFLVCMEKVFFHKNVKSAMEVGEVRGVVSLLCAQRGIKLLEISPLELKKALTNWGRASKKEIAEVLKRFFGLSFSTSHEFDAAALAICGLTYLKRCSSFNDRLSEGKGS